MNRTQIPEAMKMQLASIIRWTDGRSAMQLATSWRLDEPLMKKTMRALDKIEIVMKYAGETAFVREARRIKNRIWVSRLYSQISVN